MPVVNYDGLGGSIVVRFKLDDLSKRDKVNLFNTLMGDLGITEECCKHHSETAYFQEIWKECTAKAWNAK